MKWTASIAAAATSWIAASQAAQVPFNSSSHQSSCLALEAAGIKNVFYPGSDEYEARKKSYFSVSSRLEPYCLVRPESAKEVSKIVTTLTYDTESNFAIRSGGHTVWSGANNINKGVTIDLGLLKYTKYISETKVAEIGAGSRWLDVYGALEPYGITAPGGRTATVGVAGFLTGGGNNFFAARVGFGADNVVNFEVVLSTGEIVNANKHEHSDLWKALKGGSANFGIVTRFDVATVPVPSDDLLWGGLVGYTKNHTKEHVEAYYNWTDNIVNYPNGSVIPFWSYTPDVGDIHITVSYVDTTGVEAPPAFDEFLAIPQNNSALRKDTHKNLTIELELTSGYRNVWFAITFKNNLKLYNKALDLHRQFVADWKAQSPDGDFICHAIFQSIPTIFAKHSEQRGGNILGLDREKDNAVLFQVQHMVNGEAQEQLSRERMVGFRETLKAYSREQGTDVEWEYLNYADFTQDPLKTYGKKNVEYIRAVAKKYDPYGVFQDRLPGGFKISHVQ